MNIGFFVGLLAKNGSFASLVYRSPWAASINWCRVKLYCSSALLMMIDIRQPGCVGCALAFLALLQGWLCVGILCALQCAKNSVGSGRQSHVSLYMCRMFNRVTHNEQGFVQAWDLKNVRPEPLMIEKQIYKISCKSSAMLVKPELKLIANKCRS